MTVRWIRRGGKREPLAAQAGGPRAYTVLDREPGRPSGGSGRFTPVTARNRGVRAHSRRRRLGTRARWPARAGRSCDEPAGRPAVGGRAAGRERNAPGPPAGVDGGDRMASRGGRIALLRHRRRPAHGDPGAVAPTRVAADRARGGPGDDRRRGEAVGHARGGRVAGAAARRQLVREAVRLGTGHHRARRTGARQAGARPPAPTPRAQAPARAAVRAHRPRGGGRAAAQRGRRRRPQGEPDADLRGDRHAHRDPGRRAAPT